MAATASLAVLGLCSPALAGTIAAAEVGYDMALLSNFNLVTLGNYTNTSGHYLGIGGRAIVNGDAINTGSSGTAVCNTASACVAADGKTPSGNAPRAVDSSGKIYGTMTVFGNLVSGTYGGFGPGYQSTTFTPGVTSLGGTTYVGGTASGNFYAGRAQDLSVRGSASGLNVDYADQITTTQASFAGTRSNSTGSPTPTVNASLASVFPFSSTSLVAEVQNLAKGIANLPGTPGVVLQKLTQSTSTTAFVTAANNSTVAGKHFGVVTTTLKELSLNTGGVTVNNNGQGTTYVIVTGYSDCMECLLPTLTSTGGDRILFDFVDAKALRFAGSWNASILAPLADILSMGGTINGSVIVNSINQSQALLSGNMFVGDLPGVIPEPASLALFGVGAAAAGLMRRRRKAG